MSGDASYARMAWRLAYESHLDGDCDCPSCAPLTDDDEQAAEAAREWSRDREWAA